MRKYPKKRLEPNGLVNFKYSRSTPIIYSQVIKCLLIVPFPESALNEEAGKMFMEDYD